MSATDSSSAAPSSGSAGSAGFPPAEPPSYRPEVLFVPQREPAKSKLGRWLLHGRKLEDASAGSRMRSQPWYKVLWLTGIDYFSTLAYQPGIALLAAGALAPVATVLIVGLTLLGALPVYGHIAARSYAGQGSIALLENALEGWRGKLLVLMALGFACTGFILTMTISASDAVRHAVLNPLLAAALPHHHPKLLTLLFLLPLLFVFLGGFRKAVGWAMAIAIPYVVLNGVVIARCLYELGAHPELVQGWRRMLEARGDFTAIFVATAAVFPKLALGLSGFETSLSVMPHVKPGPKDRRGPEGRVAPTRKLLVTAALLMSAALLTSSLAATILVPPEAYHLHGPAAGRTLAYLAHKYLGSSFGTVYDISTLLILWFAAANAMLGMLNLIPRYLPRLGMAPHWVSFRRPLVIALVLVAILVTIGFDADVERQGGPYATGVLGLLLAGAVAVAMLLWRQRREEKTAARKIYCWARFFYMCLTAVLFAYALGETIVESPAGFMIVLAFPFGILTIGAASRAWRSTELRVSDLTFNDLGSAELWKAMVGKKVHAAPLRTSSREARSQKAEEIRKYYCVEGPIVFIHVNLVDNRSDFLSPLRVLVKKEDDNYVIEVDGAVAIANTIAYISELIDPISLFLGLTQQNLVTQSIKYVLWGEGEIGLMVYMILLRYWRWTTEVEDVRPNIFLMTA